MKYCFKKNDFLELNSLPDKAAVIGSDRTLSWFNFYSEVKLLAKFLEKHQLNRTSGAIIYGHKSADMITAIYACIHLNIPYIPVDEIYPKERLKAILKTSGYNAIINTQLIP